MTCPHEATIDDMICAFMHIANYQLWLKGGSMGTWLDQASYKLKVVAHTRVPKLMAKVWSLFSGEEDLNTRKCALEGSKLFASTKRNLDMLPGSKRESHCLDKLNYSLTSPNTRSMRAHIKESLKSMTILWWSILIVFWSQNALHSKGILFGCHIHPSKNAKLCRPIHGMHARPKLPREFMAILLQFARVWKRNTVPTTMSHFILDLHQWHQLLYIGEKK